MPKAKLKWYLRQTVPTKYASAYRNARDGKPMFSTWWMWLGKSFKVKHIPI